MVDPAALDTVIDVGVTAAIVPRTRLDGAADAPGEAAAGELIAVVWPGCEQATSAPEFGMTVTNGSPMTAEEQLAVWAAAPNEEIFVGVNICAADRWDAIARLFPNAATRETVGSTTVGSTAIGWSP